MQNESVSQKAARLGAKDVTARFVKSRLRRLRVVAATPQEPTLQTDTVIYQDTETGEYYKLVRGRG